MQFIWLNETNGSSILLFVLECTKTAGSSHRRHFPQAFREGDSRSHNAEFTLKIPCSRRMTCYMSLRRIPVIALCRHLFRKLRQQLRVTKVGEIGVSYAA